MGAWGTGIFQDDTACDVRDDYRDHIGDGLSGPESTARILKSYASSLADPGEAGVVWLALAATQWRCGRLEQETLKAALAVIDSGSDLARWKVVDADYRKRGAALEKLRTQLMSPQPDEKKIRRRLPAECDWQVGELISYRLLSGKLIVFRMIGLHSDKGGKSPYVELLDWSGEVGPSLDVLRSLPIRTGKTSFGTAVTRLLLLGTRTKFKNRLKRLETTSQPQQTKLVPAPAVLWKQLDARLAAWFDLG